MKPISALIVFVLLVSACGKDNPVKPTPPPPQPVNIAGSWSGTFESQTYLTEAILMDLNQIGANVTGTWAQSGGVKAFGNVNGTVSPTSFIGTISYNYAGGSTCSASFSGPTTTTTINWTSPGFTTGDCGLASPGNPLGVRFVLQRR